MSRKGTRTLRALLLASLLLTACRREAPERGRQPRASGSPTPLSLAVAETSRPAVARPAPVATEGVDPAPVASTPARPPASPPYPGPFPETTARCGVLLPIVARAAPAVDAVANPNPALDRVPEAARPALRAILRAPQDAALVAFELGREEEGIYHNADVPMPLASVVKVIHLVAYAQAVQDGELDPQMVVPLSDLERYYLPNSDLRAHPQALAALRAEERVFGQPPAVRLEDVPRMMIEFSSNAAADYLHLLLGQRRIEQTILDLGLASHSAPCPFLGQFLLMGGRDRDGTAEVRALAADPELYSRAVMSVTLAYSERAASSAAPLGWRSRAQRPALDVQSLFSEVLNTRASARDYANLMGRIADNQLGPWEQSVRIRRYLEWPTGFPTNQERLAWLGYKGGSLPGVLTVVYYAQPWDRQRPVVVALFLHNLPLQTYREWRHTLPHDELARWLLYDREAIQTVRTVLAP